MLRDKESREREFHRYVEIGRDNQTCISGMRRWCENVEVEPEASGLYAEVTGLPIGSYHGDAISTPQFMLFPLRKAPSPSKTASRGTIGFSDTPFQTESLPPGQLGIYIRDSILEYPHGTSER